MGILGQQKPLASLSSTLLARKGQAQPAMRRQGHGGFNGMSAGHDDLGWNDMGTDVAPFEGPPFEASPLEASMPVAPVAVVPPVLRQREVLVEEFAAPAPEPVADIVPEPVAVPAPPRPAERKSVSVATAARMGRETAKKRGKAAFTLRLDQDRHLRLRLAGALHNLSAQTLVTEALDQFLNTMPEVDALIAQIPPRAKR